MVGAGLHIAWLVLRMADVPPAGTTGQKGAIWLVCLAGCGGCALGIIIGFSFNKISKLSAAKAGDIDCAG
jgi:flagellar biosynthesis protein FliR